MPSTLTQLNIRWNNIHTNISMQSPSPPPPSPATIPCRPQKDQRNHGSLFWRFHVGAIQNYFAWEPPNCRPIAIQSRSHKFQSRSNVGHRCCFCFTFRRSLVELVQSPSNRGPIAEFGGETSACSFQPLPAIRFGKHCLGLRRRNHSRGNFCARPRSQNEREVRRQRATSILMIISFRGPISARVLPIARFNKLSLLIF